MKQLLPSPSDPQMVDAPAPDLLSLYSYPEPVILPYVRVNLVCTANGKVSLDGRSAGLSPSADRVLFGRLRRLADVILVGANTVRADDCRGARKIADVREFRLERGQAEVPPMAVVSGSASIRPDCRLFTDTYVAPIVFTTHSAPQARLTRLEEAGAEVVVVGDRRVEMRLMLEALAERGLNRVLCEGGPSLFGSLICARAVDELCLTVGPYLGGDRDISATYERHEAISEMRLVSVVASEGTLLLRYKRAH